jgi:predicted O-methyltransferase YrrM
MGSRTTSRSADWTERSQPRYWWHRLPGMDYVPPIYSDLSDDEWTIISDWYAETDADQHVGECAVPLMSFLQGFVLGNRTTRIVQLGTHAGYSALLLGFMLRRMNATRGLFSLEIGDLMCATARRWMTRGGLDEFVEIAQLNSLNPQSPQLARQYLGGAPELVIIDSSHQYAETLQELDAWYRELVVGGLVVLHDVSRFAAAFDVTHEGGVEHALREWRQAHPEAETFCLNGKSSSMDLPRPLYKDACGLGLVHKPGIPSQSP